MAATTGDRHQRNRRDQVRSEEHPTRTLAATVAVGIGLAVLLWQLSGPPSLSLTGIEWGALRSVLAGSSLSDAQLIAASTAVAWGALAYLAFTVVFRAAAVCADRVTGGARWARHTLRLSSLVTVPAVRRVVDGGVAGILLVISWVPVSGRVASAHDATPAVMLRPLAIVEAAPHPSVVPGHDGAATPSVQYTVQRGDHLWDIARRFYADGTRYVTIFEVNRDRVMNNGERFTDPRLIRAGWEIYLPLPSTQVTVEADRMLYQVVRGDDLWSIAARLLGDGFRWMEIWDLNRGREMSDGARFSDPNLIRPGWRLELPIAVVEQAGVPSGTPVPRDLPDQAGTLAAADPLAEPAGEGAAFTDAWPAVPRPLAVTAAGFALLGAGILFVRRLRREGVLRLPTGTRSAASGPGDAGRVVLVSRAAVAALTELGFAEARLLTATESGGEVTVVVTGVDGSPADVADAARGVASLLDCTVDAGSRDGHHVELRLRGDLAPAMRSGSDAPAGRVLPVPVGADAGGALVYLDLAGVGAVTLRGPEARYLLRNWVSTLASTTGADELTLRVDETTRQVLPEVGDLPHLAPAAPCPETAALVDELQELVHARAWQDWHVPVVALLDLGGPVLSGLASVLEHGPGAGVFVVGVASDAATEHADDGFGASVTSGMEFPPPDGANDDGPDPRIRLVVAGTEPMLLDPVVVRRDTSPRWSALAGIAVQEVEAVSVSDPEPEMVRPAADEERPGDPAPDPPAPSPSRTFDWHAALFQPQAGAAPPAATEPVSQEEAHDSGESDAPDPRAVDVPPAVPAEPLAPGGVAPVVVDLAIPERPVLSRPVPSATSDSTRGRPTAPPAEAPPRQQGLFAADEAVAAGERHAGSAGPIVTVRCLGEFEVSVCGTPVMSWEYEKTRELLALLVAHGGAPVSRRVAADQLWPGFEWDASLKKMTSNAASSLRGIIRQGCGEPDLQPLTLVQDRFQLQYGLFAVDLDDFEATLRRAAGLPDGEALEQYERALALYRGDYLAYERFEWAESHRVEHRRRFVEATVAAAEIVARLGDLGRACTLLERAIEHAPTDEAAARCLMTHLAARGNEVGARKVYRLLAAAIQAELDDPRAAPSSETRAVLESLTSGASVAR